METCQLKKKKEEEEFFTDLCWMILYPTLGWNNSSGSSEESFCTFTHRSGLKYS